MIRTDPVDEDELEYAGDQVERVFKALERVAAIDDPAELLDERLALVEDANIQQSAGEEGATVILEEGTWHEVEIDDETVEVLVELDGRATLAEAIDRARVPRRRSTLADIQELLELGMLDLRS
jgi:hypothetical protein